MVLEGTEFDGNEVGENQETVQTTAQDPGYIKLYLWRKDR